MGLLPSAYIRCPPNSELRLFVNPSVTDFSLRDSPTVRSAPAASAGPASPVAMQGQQRDTHDVMGGLIEVILSAVDVPVAFVALLADAEKSFGSGANAPAANAAAGAVDHSASDNQARRSLLYGRDTALAGTLARSVCEVGEPLLIEDTRTHAVLRGVQTVRGVRVLACLAVPVTDANGNHVAALCALDGVPRWWTPKDVMTLTHVADAIAALIKAPPPADVAPTAVTQPHPHHLDIDVRADRRTSVADTLFDRMPDGALLIDRSWTVRWFNNSLVNLLNVPAGTLEQMSSRDLLRPHADSVVLAGWQRALDTNTADVAVWHHRASNRWLEAHAWPVANGLAILLRDVSDAREAALASERRAEAQRNARSFSAIEQLAGGVAHAFNNLLTIVRANAELMQLGSAADEMRLELQEIQRAATRATDITQQLLAFGQQQQLEPVHVSLNHALSVLEPALRPLLPTNVRVETSLSVESTMVRMDPAQLQDIVLHLVRNAREAMPEGGTLSLSTDAHVFDRPQASKPFAIPAGSWVSLTVHDTGVGIAPEHMSRVFEPFFTTRDVGSGVGLGLPTVSGVVAQSGGLCSLESEPGLGTSLTIWLPAINPLSERPAVRAPIAPNPAR